MAIGPGTRVGPYEISALIGEGGMGQVFRATDINLKRAVAIKVLPAAVASDAGRMARFEREAELLARLNHPHVAQIHGLERGGGTTAIVMELVEGPTLAETLARRRTASSAGLPADEALAIAKQIVEALEAAHEQGVVHRDLKPSNVKVRPDGTVKVLDFGLAKIAGAPAELTPELADSPTEARPADTQAGSVLGTAAYMSPEQAHGQPVDARTDVWAFGVVLFEMLSGRRPFQGATAAEVLTAVMRQEPDWSLIPREVPPRITRLIRLCLQKNPKQRVGGMQDLRLGLEGAFDATTADRPDRSAVSSPAWRPLLFALAGATAALALVSVVPWPTVSDRRDVTRFSVPLPAGMDFVTTGRASFAVSPDGRHLVYNTNRGIYARSMDDETDRLLPGTEGAVTNPFFSPDGQSLGYFQSFQLKRQPRTGGPALVIAPARNPLGVTWAGDTIYFGQTQGIMSVPASGGTPTLAIRAGEGEVLDDPQVLPDGDSVLFSITSLAAARTSNRWDSAQVAVQSLRTGQRKILVRDGSDARYVLSGHLLYVRRDGLYAVGFDAGALEVRGTPQSIVAGVSRVVTPQNQTASAAYDVSRDGTLFYASGEATSGPLLWVDRDGKANPITTIRPNVFTAPRISPDGGQLLVMIDGDLRTYEVATGRETRLTFDGGAAGFAEWHPRAPAVAYSLSVSGAGMNAWLLPTDGPDKARRLTTFDDGRVDVDGWSPDGRTLAFHTHQGANTDVFTLDFADGKWSAPRPFLSEGFTEQHLVFSPDGRFAAYQSNETGRFEVHIRPFPGPGAAEPVSVGGGDELAWALNGELFYRRLEDSAMMAVPVRTSPTLSVGEARELFRLWPASAQAARRYDVTADGKRFVMPASMVAPERGGSAESPAIHVVLNWIDELKRLVPAK